MYIQQKQNLKAACYYKNVRFGNFIKFFSLVNQSGEKINLTNLKDKPWRRNLLIQDFKDLITAVNSKKIQKILTDFNQDNGVKNQYKKIIECAGNLLCFDRLPNLYIVDTLPPPFESKEWDAMSVDKKDEEIFKIPQGIYFKKDVLTHCYFEFLVAHEIVHWAISEHSTEYFSYVPWLEEGICDILGALILTKSLHFPTQVITNLFIYNRALTSSSLWQSYWNSCKQVIWLLWLDGPERMINLVQAGRAVIAKKSKVINTLSIPEIISVVMAPYLHDIGHDIGKITWPEKMLDSAYQSERLYVETIQIISGVTQANSAFAIPIDDYSVLLATIENKDSKNLLAKKDISKILQMPEDLVENCLKSLDRSGYLVLTNNKIYQANDSIPINLKYML